MMRFEVRLSYPWRCSSTHRLHRRALLRAPFALLPSFGWFAATQVSAGQDVAALHGADVIDGGAGNDILIGQGSDDVLYGGLGNDKLYGDDRDKLDTPNAVNGADYLDGGDGAEDLVGGGRNDDLFGGLGEFEGEMMQEVAKAELGQQPEHRTSVNHTWEVQERSSISIVGALIGGMALALVVARPNHAAAADEQTKPARSKPHYTVSEGRGWSVCEEYLRALNSASASDPPPLCDLHLDRVPSVAQIGAQELRLDDHLHLVHEIELLLGASKVTPPPAKDFDGWRRQFDQRSARGEIPRLRRYQGPLTPDGPRETIFLYDVDLARCAATVQKKLPGTFAGSHILYFDSKRNKVLQDNIVEFKGFNYELRLYKGRLHAFRSYAGSDLTGPKKETLVDAGWVGVYRFRAIGADPAINPDTNRYAQQELCRIRYDYPFPR